MRLSASALAASLLTLYSCSDQEPPLQALCRRGPLLPASSQVWLNDTAEHRASAAGFALSANHTLIFVDVSGNLVRRLASGETKVWIEDAARRATSLVVLPTGEVVLADAGIASVVKFHPSGARTVLRSALDIPSSLEVDMDGIIYVAERLSRTIRRIDPKTSQSEVVAANMATAPGALAFSPDYKTLYVAGAEDGAVWALAKNEKGSWDPPRLFSDVPGSVDLCRRLTAGESCGPLDEPTGTCTPTEAGRFYCQGPANCSGLDEAADCVDELGQNGSCQNSTDKLPYCAPRLACTSLERGDRCTTPKDPSTGRNPPKNNGTCDLSASNSLYCKKTPQCEGKASGDECTTERGDNGVCADSLDELTCVPKSPCVLKQTGDSCNTIQETAGVCIENERGFIQCTALAPCVDKSKAAACVTELDSAGLCTAIDGGSLYCRVPLPCEESVAGDACETRDDVLGRCVDYRDAEPDPERLVTAVGLFCEEVDDCEEKALDDDCTTQQETPGHCVEAPGGFRCEPVTACQGLGIGDPCALSDGQDGLCVQPFLQELFCDSVEDCDLKEEGDTCEEVGTCTSRLSPNRYCQVGQPCESASLGKECQDPEHNLKGTCAERNDGGLYCRIDDPCRNASPDDVCETGNRTGTCQAAVLEHLYCWLPEPCEGTAEGELCSDGSGPRGICIDSGDGDLECEVGYPTACRDFGEGYPCATEAGADGVCVKNADGRVTCGDTPPCFERSLGSACEGAFGVPGSCETDALGGAICELPPPCFERQTGDSCLDQESGRAGTCSQGALETMVCLASVPCEDKDEGDVCTLSEAISGVCIGTGEASPLWCHTGVSSGTLSGLNTDACGNVYVTDIASEMVWMLSPDGRTIQPASPVGREGVTHLAWGTGNEEWASDTLYLGVHGSREVLAMPAEIPGRSRPQAETAVPPAPVEDTAFDCLRIPQGPLGEDRVRELERPRGFHDLAFDSEGYIIGHDGFNLVRVNEDNESELFATGIDAVSGMDWMPDGSLVASTEKGLARIYPNGAQTILATDVAAYGVTVGPDGMVYADSNGRVYRVNPQSGEREVFLDSRDFGFDVGLRSVDFDPDFTVMYLTTLGSGSILAVPLDEALNVAGPLKRFATIPGSFLQDGLGVDICGNLYVPVFERSALFRISPDGRVEKILQLDARKYGHGLEWGSGIGGFDATKLYMPQPYDNNTVIEVDIGVPSRRSSAQPR